MLHCVSSEVLYLMGDKPLPPDFRLALGIGNVLALLRVVIWASEENTEQLSSLP